LFLLHKMSKMAPQGSKIAIIFNGSPLFNGDAGSGPSDIRKHILENDLLDAIVALPNDLFYNTGIATYIWLLNNRKPKVRRDKVQLINANGEAFYISLRKNLGKKRVEISEEQASAIVDIYETFEDSPLSKIFDTEDFGFTKVTVERPLRLRFDLTPEQRATVRLDKEYLKFKDNRGEQLNAALDALTAQAPWPNDAAFFSALAKQLPFKLSQGFIKTLRGTLAVRDETAVSVKDESGKPLPDPDLRDTESIPLKEDIDAYFAREVLPHVPDAWLDRSKDKVGYEISFTKYFYEYATLRSTAEIAAELLDLDKETENLLREIVQG
jgi:type I restriction enzyme M protein